MILPRTNAQLALQDLDGGKDHMHIVSFGKKKVYVSLHTSHEVI